MNPRYGHFLCKLCFARFWALGEFGIHARASHPDHSYVPYEEQNEFLERFKEFVGFRSDK